MDWMQLWTEWEIQILVLVSFTLQVVLLLAAGIRRRSISIVLRMLLWLAYLSADIIATLALGHLSKNKCNGDTSCQHRLVAFWAPFLLLHLGGQDTITAYSLEDNKLWLRHLLTLVVQVSTAAYVLYKSMGGGGLLIPAAILMFLAGSLKYGERIWALRCANIDSLRSSLEKSIHPAGQIDDAGISMRGSLINGNSFLEEAEQLDRDILVAHTMFPVFHRLFVDLTINWVPNNTIALDTAESCYSVVQHELSLMFDILYTKAAVIHTWYGYCIRLISFLSTIAALVLFVVASLDGYSRVDVAITYVLLIGAAFLEINAICQALVSTWTCAFFFAKKWNWLLRLVLSLLRFNGEKTKWRWSNSMGQYNLVDFCFRDKSELRGIVAKRIGLEDWWNKAHYTSYVEVSQAMKAFIFQELKQKVDQMRNSATPADLDDCRGLWVLREKSLSEQLGWSVKDLQFDSSILAWHIATDIFLYRMEKIADDGTGGPSPHVIRALSNYMVFLLVVHPSILPGSVLRSRYDDICRHISITSPEDRIAFLEGERESEIPSKFHTAIKRRDFHWSVLPEGTQLAGELLGLEMEKPEKLKLVGAVWVEMLWYAAHSCRGSFHAEQLSKGGELATVVWFLTAHLGVESRLVDESSITYSIDPTI